MTITSNEYYCIEPVKEAARSFGAHLIMIFGQRSNGKTYSVLNEINNAHKERGEYGYYVRRRKEDLLTQNVGSLFIKHDPDIRYYQHAFYDDAGIVAGTVALTQSEHFKGTAVPESCKHVFLDEMFPEDREIYREFDRWQSVLSTITRDRDDVTVYMVGNTVRRTSTYFDHYHIDIRRLKQGEISLIEIKQQNGSTVKIAVEWCEKNYHVARNASNYFVDTGETNMLIDGEFESKFHYTKSFAGVDMSFWPRATKLPIGVEHNGVCYEFRVYNGVLMCAPGKIAPNMLTRRVVRTGAETVRADWFNVWPIASPFTSVKLACQTITTLLATNRFLADSIETAEIIQEITGVKKW